MPVLHITVGAPSSGKSTWAKSQGLPIVSVDDVKKEMKDSGENYNNEKIFSTARERVCAILSDNKSVIYDSTNMGYRNRKAVISAVKKLRGIDVKIVAHVFIVPINVLYDRSIERNEQIHVDTIDDALSLFQPPCKWERIDEVIYHRPVVNAREEKEVVTPAMPITKPLAEPTLPPLPKKKPVFDTATLFDDDDDDE